MGVKTLRWSAARSLKSVPVLSGCLNRLPIGVNPLTHGSEWRFEGPAEVRQLVESSGLDAPGIKTATDQAVTLSSAKRIGEHLEGNAVEYVVEVSIAAALGRELGKYRRRPSTVEQPNKALRRFPPIGLRHRFQAIRSAPLFAQSFQMMM